MAAMQEVGPSIFFSLLVITVAFLPVFTLEGTEGRLFKPLAFTKTFSMALRGAARGHAGARRCAALFIRGRIRREEENPLDRVLVAAYAPVVPLRRSAFRRPIVVAAGAAHRGLTVPACAAPGERVHAAAQRGRRCSTCRPRRPGMSRPRPATSSSDMDRELKSFPEVGRVFGKAGRAETPTDPGAAGDGRDHVRAQARRASGAPRR